MPRPLPFSNTPLTDAELNARTVDVIGDLDQLNPIYFPNTDLVSAINAVPGMMSKTVYVDQLNGNDGNDGSVNAPLATPEAAADSIPPGAYGIIYMREGQTFTLQRTIHLTGKKVVFRRWGSTSGVANPKIIGGAFTTSTGSYVYGFNLIHSFVLFEDIDIETPDNPDPTLPVLNKLFYAGRGLCTVQIVRSNIYLRDFGLFRASGITATNDLHIFSSTITTRNTGVIELRLRPSIICLYGLTITDEAGNTLAPNQLLSGIAYDATATTVSVNVISNVDL